MVKFWGMARTAILVNRISGGSIYFEADETARSDEANMRYFDTIAEAVAFVKAIRSGWRYADDGSWTRVTYNHMTATFYNTYGDIVREAETFRLDSLPEWMN